MTACDKREELNVVGDTRGDERWWRFRCRFDKRPALSACVPCIAQPHVQRASRRKIPHTVENRKSLMNYDVGRGLF